MQATGFLEPSGLETLSNALNSMPKGEPVAPPCSFNLCAKVTPLICERDNLLVQLESDFQLDLEF